eukprot:CAMPEP_0172832888 /NCGR_PEP_ID=MMETSP1075-20121228/23979_1 /TAXON_ID=2916 /ORGANISM="Ceratium fusus, Strain PA161109" /LENGTH=73 /DNA_ID=CAMNT_0013675555 /DNA_START=382 /DNA_END=599 /DNA_ORIENTATION=+
MALSSLSAAAATCPAATPENPTPPSPATADVILVMAPPVMQALPRSASCPSSSSRSSISQRVGPTCAPTLRSL